MSSPTPFSLIVTTGANGYLGLHVLKYLFAEKAAQKVRAVVRSEKSSQPIREIFSAAIEHGHLEIVYVPDILADGAYDRALEGADGVIHLASPLPGDHVEDVAKDLLDPAKAGALGIVRAASVTPSVKKVVLCSSIAAMFDPEHQPIGPATWYPATYEEAAKSDRRSGYFASKALAERAAFDFVKENKTSFKIVSLNPAVIIGPTLVPAPIADTTNRMLWSAATGGESLGAVVGYVDVRDVAKAHVKALSEPKTDGKRYLLWTETLSDAEVAEVAQKTLPRGSWKKPAEEDKSVKVDADLSDLGLDLRPIKETITEVLEIELKRIGKA